MLVLELSQLAILINVIILEFINFAIIFLALLLKELKLLLESLVSVALHHLDSLFLVLILFLEAFNDLMFHIKLMLYLSGLLIVPLLKSSIVVSEYFHFFILFSKLTMHLELKFFMIFIDLLLGFFSFFSKSEF
tara:strand:- start:151 stop:552 length:402 start_codon:yes stop_codon:yes gene_type:complete